VVSGRVLGDDLELDKFVTLAKEGAFLPMRHTLQRVERPPQLGAVTLKHSGWMDFRMLWCRRLWRVTVKSTGLSGGTSVEALASTTGLETRGRRRNVFTPAAEPLSFGVAGACRRIPSRST